MKKYIIFFVWLLLCQFAFSESIIRGKICNSKNEPLIGASIYALQQNKGAISNSKGEYQIQNLPNGKINIQVAYIGYQNQVKTIILDNSNIELNFELIETPIETDEIVVSGGYNSTQHENAVKIDALRVMDISNTTTTNFMEVLTAVPGVDMISKGSGVAKPVIRGLSLNDILVLNNGVRFENYQFSDHHPLGIDEFGIDNVEIIKGPASLLYGSDALGGVIDFLKERPAPIGKVVGEYNLQLFSNSRGITNNVGVKGATKNLFGGIRFGTKSDEDYLQGGGDFVPNTKFLGKSLKTNAGFNNELMSINMFYDYSSYKVGLAEPDAIELLKPLGRSRDLNAYYMNLNNNLFSLMNKFFLNDYLLEINSAYQKSDLVHAEAPDEVSIDMSLQTITYETRLYFPSTEKTEYIIGFQGLNQINTNNNNREEILLPNAIISNYSCFGLFQYSFIDGINIQSGLRYDYKNIDSKDVNGGSAMNFRPALNKNYGSFNGSLGATYNVNELLLFRANFATAYRTPNLAELSSDGLHEERYELGDRNLNPEKGYESDLSMHYHSDNISFEIAGFLNYLNNYIYISPSSDTSAQGNKIYKYMQSSAKLIGFEAGFHIHPKQLEFLHFETTFSNVLGKKNNGEYLPFIPANKLKIDLRIERDKLWIFQKCYAKFKTSTAFRQNKPAQEEEATAAYTIADIGLGANVNVSNQIVSLGLGANNIFDKKYIDHLSTLKEVNYFNPGRNIYFTMKVNFEMN